MNNNKVAAGILQYYNIPLEGINLSPTQILFHQQLQDSLPAHPTHYKLYVDWLEATNKHQQQQQECNQLVIKNQAPNKELSPINVGMLVLIQRKNKRWEKQGHIADLPHC